MSLLSMSSIEDSNNNKEFNDPILTLKQSQPKPLGIPVYTNDYRRLKLAHNLASQAEIINELSCQILNDEKLEMGKQNLSGWNQVYFTSALTSRIKTALINKLTTYLSEVILKDYTDKEIGKILKEYDRIGKDRSNCIKEIENIKQLSKNQMSDDAKEKALDQYKDYFISSKLREDLITKESEIIEKLKQDVESLKLIISNSPEYSSGNLSNSSAPEYPSGNLGKSSHDDSSFFSG